MADRTAFKRSIIRQLQEDISFADYQRKPAVMRRVLVINSNYQPITTITLKRAIIKLFTENAIIVVPPGRFGSIWQEFSWQEWENIAVPPNEIGIVGTKRQFQIPEIVKLSDYKDEPQRRVKLCRRAIYKRDRYCCQFCGKGVPEIPVDILTIDHVLPKSKGGKTSWDNLVVACNKCNHKKGNRTPDEAGMPLLNMPRIPEYDILQGRMIKLESWTYFLGKDYWLKYSQ